jgi:cytoskeletal protein CcmA (bactofilin family)
MKPANPTSSSRGDAIAERGLAMATVVVLTVVLVSITGALASLGLSRQREGELEVHSLRALNAAEAGISRIVDDVWRQYRCANESDRVDLVDTYDGKYCAQTRIVHEDVAFSNAVYSASVVEVVADGSDHADVTIEATGRCGPVTRRLTAVMRYGRKPSQVFNYAYFVNNFGWLWGSGIRVNGDVCSNGDFSLNGATVNGNILASKNAELGSLGTVTGTSNVDSIDWYRANVGNSARPTNPTCDLADGDDLDGNGVPDVYEYKTGFDGTSERTEGEIPVEMPYLGQLAVYEDLAARKHGTLSHSGSVVVTEVHNGTLVIEGTAADPIVIDGPVVIDGDIILKGVITGKGTIYAGRNVHVAGDLTYKNPPSWPKPSEDPEGDAAANANADLVGLVARGSVILGDYTQSTWTSATGSYLKPPFTQSYVVPATDSDIGYVTGCSGGKPTFHGDYTADDGGQKADGSCRKFYESSLSDADFAAFAGGSVEHLDGVFYTNHLFSGKVGAIDFNGSIVARDEAILFTGSIDISYDVRIHSDGYEAIDIYLPRTPMRRLLFWREDHAPTAAANQATANQ